MKQKENGFPIRDKEKENYFNQLYENLEEIIDEGHSGQIKNFIDAIEDKEELLVTAKDGYRALEIISAIYKSSLYKQLITLPLESNDEFMVKETLVEKMPRFYKKTKSVANIKDTIIL